jgi:hypothetical protein
MVLPLTNSYLLTFAKNLFTPLFFPFGGRTVTIGKKTEAVDLLKSFLSSPQDGSCNHLLLLKKELSQLSARRQL